MEPVVHENTAAAKRLAELALTAGDLIGALATWLLLYHVAPDQIRAELSLANGIDQRGHVSAWIERIILPAVPTDARQGWRPGRHDPVG
jgi:hypothetical protein